MSTYQCDVVLPAGSFNRFQTWALDRSHTVALRRSATVGVTSEDNARSSRLVTSMAGRTRELPASAVDRSGGSPTFRDGDGLHVGFLGRIVEEKGLEYLVRGFRALEDDTARLLIGGDSTKVAGGVQVEALMLGIPAIASDLPGVRMPVRLTGLGRIVPPRDPGAIAQALRELAATRPDAEAGARAARERCLAATVVHRHAQRFDELRRRGVSSPS